MFRHAIYYKPAHYLIKILVFLFFFSIPARAESFRIYVSGKEIKNISAILIKLKISPANFFILDNDFEIEGFSENDFLFKIVDPRNLILRVFFDENFIEKNLETLVITGSVDRKNYNGKLDLSIEDIQYISDFSKFIDPDLINSNIESYQSEDKLPFMGISKAEIYGPTKRVFYKSMDISISGIETYGFSIDEENLEELFINGTEAKLINNKIISSTLNLEEYQLDELPIELEIHVKNRVIKKNLGKIEFIRI